MYTGIRIPESGNFEFWILVFATRNQGFRNPSSTDKESGIPYLESRIYCVLSRIESKISTVLDSLTRSDYRAKKNNLP